MQERVSLCWTIPLTWQGGEMPARILRLQDLRLGETRPLCAAVMSAASAFWPGPAASAHPGRRAGGSHVCHGA